VPTPVPEDTSEDPQEIEASAITEPESAGAPGTGSFHFMQESELESGAFEDNAEWVERTDAVGVEDGPAQVEPAADGASMDDIPASISAPIDWAEDDGDNLPSIAGLHAKFGTSGTATPAESTPPPASQPDEAMPPPAVNGVVAPATVLQDDEDGFTQAGRGHRGRRPPGINRGDIRGGGFRGGFRGERGAFRGGDRGFRGGFRGSDRGHFRGRSDGDWRGGEGRGRGRGRGMPRLSLTVGTHLKNSL
jgi:hypothetical protein